MNGMTASQEVDPVRAADIQRARVDVAAVRQRIRELDRRVTALHLLTAADDSRHLEQAIMDAASAATDLHKVASLLGGRGLLDQLHQRAVQLGDDVLRADVDALAGEIDATRARVARSSVLTSAVSSQLDRQLTGLFGQVETSGEYRAPTAANVRPGSVGPRLVDRLA